MGTRIDFYFQSFHGKTRRRAQKVFNVRLHYRFWQRRCGGGGAAENDVMIALLYANSKLLLAKTEQSLCIYVCVLTAAAIYMAWCVPGEIWLRENGTRIHTQQPLCRSSRHFLCDMRKILWVPIFMCRCLAWSSCQKWIDKTWSFMCSFFLASFQTLQLVWAKTFYSILYNAWICTHIQNGSCYA